MLEVFDNIFGLKQVKSIFFSFSIEWNFIFNISFVQIN
jgi:hypothetical protein